MPEENDLSERISRYLDERREVLGRYKKKMLKKALGWGSIYILIATSVVSESNSRANLLEEYTENLNPRDLKTFNEYFAGIQNVDELGYELNSLEKYSEEYYKKNHETKERLDELNKLGSDKLIQTYLEIKRRDDLSLKFVSGILLAFFLGVGSLGFIDVYASDEAKKEELKELKRMYSIND